MLYKKNKIFIHIPKTAGSTIRNVLKNKMRWSEVEMPKAYNAWWHRPLSMCPKKIVGTPIVFVRDPWDYYVSWFNYDLRFIETGTAIFSELYSPDNIFEDFAVNLLSGTSNSMFRLPQKIEVPIVYLLNLYDIGLLTFFYIYMTIKNPTNFLLGKLNVDSYVPIKTYKVENLNNDFKKIFKASNQECKYFFENNYKNKTNNSDNYRDYYSKDLMELVMHKERFIINNFLYKF